MLPPRLLPADLLPVKPAKISQYEIAEVAQIRQERKVRASETLRLYEPMPFQEAFHRCAARECIIQKGNRTGASNCGFIEDARAVLGCDPYKKYPPEGTLVCLGYGESHVGKVIHKFLFEEGGSGMRIIRDEQTKAWRIYRPWPLSVEKLVAGRLVSGDLERRDETKPAPPLIPKKYIKGKIGYTHRSLRIFDTAEIVTERSHWKIYAMNSVGDPRQRQGFSVNLYHIDEDVAMGGWYEEAIARTLDCEGFIRWTAVSHGKTNDMIEMIRRAEDQAGRSDPMTVCIRATTYDNIYLTDKAVNDFTEQCKAQGDSVYRKRVLGEITDDEFRMYPSFDRRIHSAIQEKPRTKAEEILKETKGVPPRDWCRYLSVDPGHQVCAVTFWAVPPPRIRELPSGDQKVCYDELYLRRCDAETFGEELLKKTQDYLWQKFIIDMHGARQSSSETGRAPIEAYAEQLLKHGIKCEELGHGFSAGCDEPKRREMIVRQNMYVGREGYPKVLFVMDACSNTVREIERFVKKVDRTAGVETVLDAGNRRKNTHAIETVEMMLADGLEYVKPFVPAKSSDIVTFINEGRKHRERKRRMKYAWQRPGTISLAPQGDH